MKPILRTIATFSVIFTLILACGCENTPFIKGNYRKAFYGDFSFTIIVYNWRMDTGSWWDTLYYEGLVRKYIPEDSDSDLFGPDDSEMNDSKRITIEVRNGDPFITPMIEESGLFFPLSGSHYYHQGLFTDHDHLNFSVTGLGGLGGGCDYYVTGIRSR